MKIIKRSGTEVVFDIDKIVNAIRAANLEVEESSRPVSYTHLDVYKRQPLTACSWAFRGSRRS